MIVLTASVGFAQSSKSGNETQVSSNPDYSPISLSVPGYPGEIPALPEYTHLRHLSVINPVQDEVIVRSHEDLNITKVEIYDSQGRLIITEATDAINVMIAADVMKTGMYFVRIYLGNISVTKEVYKV